MCCQISNESTYGEALSHHFQSNVSEERMGPLDIFQRYNQDTIDWICKVAVDRASRHEFLKVTLYVFSAFNFVVVLNDVDHVFPNIQ